MQEERQLSRCTAKDGSAAAVARPHFMWLKIQIPNPQMPIIKKADNNKC